MFAIWSQGYENFKGARKMNAIKKKVGFALMSKDRLKEVSRQGGVNVPASKRAFAQNIELAQRAGLIGGTSIKNQKRKQSEATNK